MARSLLVAYWHTQTMKPSFPPTRPVGTISSLAVPTRRTAKIVTVLLAAGGQEERAPDGRGFSRTRQLGEA